MTRTGLRALPGERPVATAGRLPVMTTPPEPDLPQPRDIALEMEDEQTAADLEAKSDPEPPADPA